MSDDSSPDKPDGSDPELGVGPAGAGTERPSSSDLHRLLESPRKRRLLAHLVDRPDVPISVDELVDAVADGERSAPGPETHRRRVAIALHHVHLPKVADAGVIEYDPVAGTVRYDGSEALEYLLAASEAIDRPGERPWEGDRHE